MTVHGARLHSICEAPGLIPGTGEKKNRPCEKSAGRGLSVAVHTYKSDTWEVGDRGSRVLDQLGTVAAPQNLSQHWQVDLYESGQPGEHSETLSKTKTKTNKKQFKTSLVTQTA